MQGMRCPRIVPLIVCVVATSIPAPARAWSEQGHHLIAELAFLLLAPAEQQQLLRILESHPRYREDFQVPSSITTESQRRLWLVGRAGYWPDVARSQREYNRPNWHYQLASTLVIGNGLKLPRDPGPLPSTATLETRELYIAQAIELCRRQLADHRTPADQRALAVSWLAHLVADAHQPCHAGSLYVADVFPDGDRGANSISVKQGRNLHALWDGLLGSRFDAGDIRRRRVEISSIAELMQRGREAVDRADGLDPERWLTESRDLGIRFVYPDEVLGPIRAAAAGRLPDVPQIDLSETYLKNAGQVAQLRAAQSAFRLARVWQQALAVSADSERNRPR